MRDAIGAGKRAWLRVEHPHHPTQRIELACPQQAGSLREVIALETGLAVGGVLLDARGNPVGDVVVYARRQACPSGKRA